MVYDDALAPGWASWSWGGAYAFDAADHVREGEAAISASIGAWGGLSLHSDALIEGFASLRFWLRGDPAGLRMMMEDDRDSSGSDLQNLGEAVLERDGEWHLISLPLPPGEWTRITVMDATGGPQDFHVDEMSLEEAPSPRFLAAEIVSLRVVEVLGSGDPDSLILEREGVEIPISARIPLEAPARTALHVAADLEPGRITVRSGEYVFEHALARSSARIRAEVSHPISPNIYGVAYPGEGYLEHIDVGFVRQGGNAKTLYNPRNHCTNAGDDWYFINRHTADAGETLRHVAGFGAKNFLSIPSIGWVAKDCESWAYSVAKYGAQVATSPYNHDQGNGMLADGSEQGRPIDWNDPADIAIPWSEEDSAEWLRSLPIAPEFVAIDNEMDIWGGTHRAVHPEPTDYDEVLARYREVGAMAKDVLPDAQLVAPSFCCWWFYWNSAAGADDKAAHGGVDLIPWFLREAAAWDRAQGRRVLDYLDLHYYVSGPPGYKSGADTPEARAWRLRSTRSLWDSSYQDEGWIGVNADAAPNQPAPHSVHFIRRFKALIEANYPGTRLAIGEWSWGPAERLDVGLATADALGIFGREGLDMAALWVGGDWGTPTASAFALFRPRGETAFGDRSLPTTSEDPEMLAVFAATDEADRATVVLINKHPATDLVVALPDLPASAARTRRFGGSLGALFARAELERFAGEVVVPAYSALLLIVDPAPGPPARDAGPDAEPTRDAGAGDDAGGRPDGSASVDQGPALDGSVGAAADGTAPDTSSTSSEGSSGGCVQGAGQNGRPLALPVLLLALRRRKKGPAPV